jgi:hypothetical protein
MIHGINKPLPTGREKAEPQESGVSRLRLKIEPVIRNAEDVKKRVEIELPHHTGLISLAGGVAVAAREAEKAAERLRRPLGLHRLPALFLLLALLVLAFWLYAQFFWTTTLRIALPDRDAMALRTRIAEEKHLKAATRLQLEPIEVKSSLDAVKMVSEGKSDLAFVQGGIDIPPQLPRLETPHPELVLWFVRPVPPVQNQQISVLTSLENAGSHLTAQAFMKGWKIGPHVEYVHDWTRLSRDDGYVIPDNVNRVFVVKDPSDDETLRACERLAMAGFHLESPDLGAFALRLKYLKPYVVPARYLSNKLNFPVEPVETYTVETYLVAREGLTPRMLAAASHLFEGQRTSIVDGRYEPTVGETSEVVQGVDAFLGIIINLVLAFLALTGLEMWAYRKRIHELNSLISLISIHQSSKDVLGVADESVRKDHMLYLSLCSDLLGLVSMIAGYYTQENSSLLFSGMPEIIHQRCDGLKINIQLKILHATIKTEPAVKKVAELPATAPPIDGEK